MTGECLQEGFVWLTNDREIKGERMMRVCFGLQWLERCDENDT